MKILSSKKNNFDYDFSIELDFEKWKQEYEKERINLSKNIQISGFRKGHVPLNIVDERFTPNQIAASAIEKLQNKMIDFVISSKEFKDLKCVESCHNIDFEKIDGINSSPILKLSFDSFPIIDNYNKESIKQLTINKFNLVKKDDQFIKHQIKLLVKNDVMASEKNGPIAMGDMAIINFEGFIDNKKFEGGEGKNFELEIGSKTFIDTFEQQLIGLKKGDKKSVNVVFPSDYQVKEYANKPAVFNVEIINVKSLEYPKISKEYLKKFNIDANNEEELANYIRNIFKEQDEEKYNVEVEKALNDDIIKKAKINYFPKSLINMYSKQIIKQYESESSRAGFSNLNAYLKKLNMSNEKFNDVVNDAAKKNLIISVVYQNLMDEYKLKVDDNDKNSYIEKLTRYFNDKKKAEETYMNNKEYCESIILRIKLIKFVINDAIKK